MDFSLEQQGRKAILNPQLAQIEAALKVMDARKHSFCTLSHPEGSYVQTAGSMQRLTVEFRKIEGESFWHYVLGRDSGSSEKELIECEVGPIELQANEVFSFADALEIFETFRLTSTIPANYRLREVTQDFR